jgi:hypothetical protein
VDKANPKANVYPDLYGDLLAVPPERLSISHQTSVGNLEEKWIERSGPELPCTPSCGRGAGFTVA